MQHLVAEMGHQHHMLRHGQIGAHHAPLQHQARRQRRDGPSHLLAVGRVGIHDKATASDLASQ